MRPEKFNEYYEYILPRANLLVKDETGTWFKQMVYSFRISLIRYINSYGSEVFVELADMPDKIVEYPMFEDLWRDKVLAEEIIRQMVTELEELSDGELEFWVVTRFLERIYAAMRRAVAKVEEERKQRTHSYKEELIATVYHPDRACRIAEKFGMEPMNWLILQAEGTGWEE